ncbi:30S ribosomal protein S20 [bacterium]|nr:30S ribosomal protein S20 [bacterium]
MPQHKSAIKKVKTDEKRTLNNRAIRSRFKTEIKKLRNLIKEKKTDGLDTQLKKTISLIDKTRSKGVIHHNKSARIKSRLTKHVSNLLATS